MNFEKALLNSIYKFLNKDNNGEDILVTRYKFQNSDLPNNTSDYRIFITKDDESTSITICYNHIADDLYVFGDYAFSYGYNVNGAFDFDLKIQNLIEKYVDNKTYILKHLIPKISKTIPRVNAMDFIPF